MLGKELDDLQHVGEIRSLQTIIAKSTTTTDIQEGRHADRQTGERIDGQTFEN